MYKNPDQLSCGMCVALAKRGGFKGRKKIQGGKVSDVIWYLRKQAAEELKKNMKPFYKGPKPKVYVAAPVTRVSGGLCVPPIYSNLDYIEQEEDLRKLAHGPLHEWAEVLPHHEEQAIYIDNLHPQPDGDEKLLTDTKTHMKELSQDRSLGFLKDCTEHMSTFIKARTLQDRMHGIFDTNASIKNGLAVATELGLPSLQNEASKMMENKFRSGKCSNKEKDHPWKVRFGTITHIGKNTSAEATIMGRPWAILDYGDTIPGVKNDPINDCFGSIINERNKCLAIHLAAGVIHSQSTNPLDFNNTEVMSKARALRWEQYKQAKTCHGEIGPMLGNEPWLL